MSMFEGSNGYVTVAYALTWVVMLGYWVRLETTRRRAERALNDRGGQ